MALSAIWNSKRVISTQLSDDDWTLLRNQSRQDHEVLRMAYSGLPCIGKTSSLGLRFFAHRAGVVNGELPAWSETAEHLLVKSLIVSTVTNAGWDASTEVMSADRSWIADTLVKKNMRSIAFEVQWSRQSIEDYRFRTDRYRQAGIECYWLSRHNPFIVNNESADVRIFPLVVDIEKSTAQVAGLRLSEFVVACLNSTRVGFGNFDGSILIRCEDCDKQIWAWGGFNGTASSDLRNKRNREIVESALRRSGKWEKRTPIAEVTTLTFRENPDKKFHVCVCPFCEHIVSDDVLRMAYSENDDPAHHVRFGIPGKKPGSDMAPHVMIYDEEDWVLRNVNAYWNDQGIASRRTPGRI
ncbi:hypothetical protein EAH68_00190 [Corynebacterium hylobatis]|uniref:Competence protein CoiA nuclease-like domain-containing protein n=1 Tax=Corynebacterium hylobatis TaxID=1859290 RepID=A0A3R9ZFW7_9CORY|nr:competence protein CoiA family protein [Corynebacterium hylobatis]RSZ66018.1 hypothetical protein EAH68_00190 [Corynebacterium hylobatis]